MHRTTRQTGICAVAVVAALVFSIGPSDAQPWPQRSVKVIVPLGPGSSPDIAARLFAEQLGLRWGKAVVVENVPGADGLVGTAAFAAARDDHVLLFSPAAPITVYPFIQEKISYDPERDMVPISAAVDTFGAISVTASLPVTTLPELVEHVRSRPGKLNWASGGGAFPILIAGLLKIAKLDMAHVPYRDQNLGIQDLAEGRIQLFATAMTALLPLAQGGKIRIVAMTNKERSPLWPDIPTVAAFGYPELAFEGLIGVFAPRGTPDGRRQQISADIRAVAADPAVAQRLAATGQIVRGSTPAEFAAAIEEQRSRISAIVRLIGKSRQ
jgi:tripartite-type tricarboxylate transporter receptor subunit TctC